MPKRWTVFFDIGQVLVKYDPKQVACEMARLIGRHPMRVARYLWDSDLVERIERGELAPSALYRLFTAELGFTGSYDDFKRLWSGFFKPQEDTAALFEQLQKKYPVYLLSNTNYLHWDHIRRTYPFAQQARGAVLSFRLGLRKPELQIYRHAADYARAEPADCIFIDDRKDNVEAAIKVGMNGLRFTGAPALRQQLRLLGAL